MSRPNLQPRFNLLVSPAITDTTDFAAAVREGLTGSGKQLPCRFFYDRIGSDLFDQICNLPEYYLPRAERAILTEKASEIVALFSSPMTLAELGCGSAVKTRLLIGAALKHHGALRFVPVDISRAMLEETCAALQRDFPILEIYAVAGEYEDGLLQLKALTDRAKLILWLGSNIGNFDRAEAEGFLRRVKQAMEAGDRLLVGIDLRKERRILEAAYDDAAGITAQFNLNLLARINRELGGHFDLSAFRHRAVYNENAGRVEMYLISSRSQRVAIDQLGLDIEFAAGETIHTENSYKYSEAEIAAVATASGFSLEHQWFDADHRFCTTVFAR